MKMKQVELDKFLESWRQQMLLDNPNMKNINPDIIRKNATFSFRLGDEEPPVARGTTENSGA